ncbi:MAG: membrane dipeptidase [Gemmatimonadaceae bacterium]|nr:membrane dipeptidase [Acetobacteraceae bacterium]
MPTANPDILALHHETVVFDAATLRYATTEPYASRIHAAGVDVISLTMASEQDSWEDTLQHIEVVHDRLSKVPFFKHCMTHADVMAAVAAGKTAVIFGTQGATPIGTKLWRLRTLHRLGVRFFGLAYTGASLFGDGCGEWRNAGLTFLGQELIALANEIGMIVDLSHCGHQTRLEAAEAARFPVCTHSNAYSVTPNDRNTKDDAALAIAANGGVVGVTGLVRAVAEKDPTLDHIVDHVDYLVNLLGPAHVGIGLDMTEGFQDAVKAGQQAMVKPPKWRTLRPDIFGTAADFYTVPYPRGIETISQLPDLTAALVGRGYPRDQVQDIMGHNWLRVFHEATKAA